MEANRKFWNEQQQALKRALAVPARHAEALQLCLGQHAMTTAPGWLVRRRGLSRTMPSMG